jgi:predicted enzyme related to lactoylglutathione lyase
MPRPIHFEIHASDPQRLIKFYGGFFGWQFTAWADQPYWLVKTGEQGTPGIDGGLMQRRGPPPPEMAAVNAFVCTVDVADLDTMVGKLVELGGVVALPKMPVPAVGWLAYGKDPDGNLFGMMQMDAKAA